MAPACPELKGNEMKKLIATILIAMAVLAGCATLTETQSKILDTAAMDAGYAAWRLVPDARPVLTAICALQTDTTDPAVTAREFQELIGIVWKRANSTDAAIVILTLNNLVGLVSIRDELSEACEGTMRALKGICQGVDLAQKGMTK